MEYCAPLSCSSFCGPEEAKSRDGRNNFCVTEIRTESLQRRASPFCEWGRCPLFSPSLSLWLVEPEAEGPLVVVW
jgi:hypothetical protein